MCKHVLFVLFMALILLITACSGCSSSSSDTQPTKNGVFLDSPVEGLGYQAGDILGLTNADGTFSYSSGDRVRFFIGDIGIGSTFGKAIITPLDLVEGATGLTDSTVVNIARFLQSLDDDGKPENGISISEQVRDLAAGQTIDFEQSIIDFETDGNVQMIVATLTAATSTGAKMLVSNEDAIAHLSKTLGLDEGGDSNDENADDEIVLADNPQALPLCLTSIATDEEWRQLKPAVNIGGYTGGIGYDVMHGLHFNCAAQLRLRFAGTYDDDGFIETNGLVALPEMRATPQTIFPLDGDDQRIFFSVDAPMVGSFSACYPGDSRIPNNYCTEGFYDAFGVGTGTMLYRVSGPDGNFETSRWIVGEGVPGFIIKRVSANCTLSSRCEFQVFFVKGADGKPSLKYDVQVIIQVSVLLENLPEIEGVTNHRSAQAIPLLIKQTRD